VEDTKLRIGVVGLGTFVEIAHFPTYTESVYADNIEVGAICDLNESRLNEIGEKYGVTSRYVNLAEMLSNESLDALVVITPDHAHTTPVLAGLNHGLDVLVEKPLAMSVRECDQMIETAQRARRRVRTDFHKREDPAHQEARVRLAANHYGEVQAGFAWMQDRIFVPAGGFFKSDLASRSSPVWFLGVHYYDLVCWVTGLKPVQVRAVGHKKVLASKGIDTFDSIKADFIFSNGATISFLNAWHLPDTLPAITKQGLYLQCTEGELTIDTMDRGFWEVTPQEILYINSMFTRRTENGYKGYGHESIGEILAEFRKLKIAQTQSQRDAVYKELEAREPSGKGGFYATLMAQAVHRSLDEGDVKKAGQIYIGKQLDLNDLLKEELGKRASQYPLD
jgi:predicted dehydrogenase